MRGLAEGGGRRAQRKSDFPYKMPSGAGSLFCLACMLFPRCHCFIHSSGFKGTPPRSLAFNHFVFEQKISTLLLRTRSCPFLSRGTLYLVYAAQLHIPPIRERYDIDLKYVIAQKGSRTRVRQIVLFLIPAPFPKAARLYFRREKENLGP